MNFCSYGCGQEAKYYLKNGKWCCSVSQNSCPIIRKKFSRKRFDMMGDKNVSKRPEVRKILSDKRKGKTVGWPHTEETEKIRINKIKKTILDKYGVENVSILPEVRKLISQKVKSSWEREEVRKKKTGENHPFFGKFGEESSNWRGGISKFPYGFDFTKKLKNEIRKRDNYTCQLCFKYGKCIHHIDENKDNNNPTNLITLCISCNVKISNKDKGIWSMFYVLYFHAITMGSCKEEELVCRN